MMIIFCSAYGISSIVLVIHMKSVDGIVVFLVNETMRFWWNFITKMYVSFGGEVL